MKYTIYIIYSIQCCLTHLLHPLLRLRCTVVTHLLHPLLRLHCTVVTHLLHPLLRLRCAVVTHLLHPLLRLCCTVVTHLLHPLLRLRCTVVTLIITILMHSYSVAFCPVFVLLHFVLWHFVRVWFVAFCPVAFCPGFSITVHWVPYTLYFTVQYKVYSTVYQRIIFFAGLLRTDKHTSTVLTLKIQQYLLKNTAL